MERIEPISEKKGYSVVNIGRLDELMAHSFIHPVSKQKVEGKVFLKDATAATGSEISLNTIPPKTEVPYFHTHEANEETYIFIKGFGHFQVDDDCFPIEEGSVVRVATKTSRGLRNLSDSPMIYIVVQSKEGSLGNFSSADGHRTEFLPKWDR